MGHSMLRCAGAPNHTIRSFPVEQGFDGTRKGGDCIVKIRAFLMPALVFALFDVASADPSVGTAAYPAWADQIEVGQFSRDRTGEFRQGVALLLLDRQVRKTSDGFDYLNHVAYKVVDRTGLEDSARIAQPFDPSTETLSFNFVRIVRDGDVIDRLTDADITLLRQEEGLDSDVINGELTALIQLEDVRVGDVIDYSYSGSVASSLWPEEYFETESVEFPMPVARMHFKLLVPEKLKVQSRSVATDLEPTVTKRNGWKSFELDVRDPDPVRIESNVPADWTTFGFVAFTTMGSWSDVVHWAIPVFSVDESLPPTFTDKLDEIADAYPRPEERATQALRLVQADIRYLGDEVGLGSHVPRPPGVTLDRGYGDCKDKSVLLVSALRYLGIKAFPVLASISDGDGLSKIPPAVNAFDHVIVGIEIDGRKFWVDPTLSHQGGTAGTFAPLGYGYVLPVRRGQSRLVKLDFPVPETPVLEMSETLEIPESGDVGLRLTAEHTYRSSAADLIRIQIASSGEKSFDRGLLNYYTAIYDGIVETQALKITDDIDANEVVVRAEYEMDAETFRKNDFGTELPVVGMAVQDILPNKVEANRIAPLGLPYGTNARHIIRVVTPGRRLALPESTTKTVSGITYARSFRNDGEAFEMEYDLLVTERVAEQGTVKTITDLADDIAEETELVVRLGAALPTLTKQLGLAAPVDDDTENAVAKIRTQIAGKEYVEALTGLNRLVDAHKEATKLRGFLQLLKATVLVELGRDKASIRPFEEAFELYEPPTVDSYFSYMYQLQKADENARVVEVAVRMLDRHPDAIDQLRKQWIGDFSRRLWLSDMMDERESLLLAVARAAHKTQTEDIDEIRWVFAESVEILSKRGEVDEASQYLRYVKSPKVLAGLLADRDTEAIWAAVEQDAGPDLSHAIDGYLAYAKEAADAAPGDFKKLQRHLDALRLAGRIREAVEFGEPIVQDWQQIEAVGEDAYWFVNDYVYVLSDAGKPDQAQALMARLVGLGISENGQLISMAINRAGLLMHWGKFDASLKAIEDIENLDGKYASDYGMMWIYDIKACSLYQLGRKDEAEVVMKDSIGPLADKNPSAHTEALLCFGEMDEAANLIVNRLHDDKEKKDAILTFVQVKIPKSTPPFLSELLHRADEVRARPEVRKEFDKVGRAISINASKTYWGEF